MVDFRKQVTEQQMLFHLVYVKYLLYIHTEVMSWRMFNKMLSGSISNDYFSLGLNFLNEHMSVL